MEHNTGKVNAERSARSYGPAVGEPPLQADPRRWGSLIGLAGGMAFIAAYSPVLGRPVSAMAWAAGLVGVATALFAHYIHPVRLGSLARPRRLGLAVYCGCVFVELALIAVGTRILAATGQNALRPALIAAVVGLHFLPLAWAFTERMFLYIGVAATVLGAAGLLVGAFGVRHAADALAVMAGLAIIAFIALFAQGRFVSARPK